MLRVIVCAAISGALVAGATACPSDTESRAPGVLLVVQGALSKPLALDAVEWAKLPVTRLTQRQLLSSDASAASDRSTVHEGVLLREVLARAGFGVPTDRAARLRTIEGVATDGYRAVFSWGELFNSSAGEHTLISVAQDGRALDATAGPLALRALADIRPGPRHVRNLCGVRVLP